MLAVVLVLVLVLRSSINTTERKTARLIVCFLDDQSCWLGDV